jgi:hypothetical protein
MSESADPFVDPYSDMTPAYGSADGPGIDFSVEAAMPEPVPAEPSESAAAEPISTESGAASAGSGAAEDAAGDRSPASSSSDTVPDLSPDPTRAQQGADPIVAPLADPVTAPTKVPETGSVERESDAGVADALAVLRAQATESAGAAERQAAAITALGAQLAELLRLRARDVDLADRLYAENTRLRTGEFAAAVAPLLTGLLRLHDQMASLANGDPASVAGMLRIQLLQILDTAAGLTPFEPRPGERFDASRHAGAGRTVTTDPTAEGTVARTLKPGFERADGSVVRVAQVEVHRFESR